MVEEALRLLGPELENRGLQVVTWFGRGIPEVRLDPAQIKQALLNLVKNAMQSMTRGTLTLIHRHHPDDVWLAVADTGSGIAVDQLNRLFEPFYTTKRKGSGLGLMVVQRIVQDHGDDDVESEVGRGTTFRIRLPRQKLIALGFPSSSALSATTGCPAPTLNFREAVPDWSWCDRIRTPPSTHDDPHPAHCR